jgi:hypothetical protein
VAKTQFSRIAPGHRAQLGMKADRKMILPPTLIHKQKAVIQPSTFNAPPFDNHGKKSLLKRFFVIVWSSD